MSESWDLFHLQGKVIEEISGFLFITVVDNPVKGFIADTNDINNVKTYTKIVLPENTVQNILDQDKTFGCLVGGEYFYFAMPAILKGAVINQENNEFSLKKSSVLILLDDGLMQEIFINEIIC